jgi:16S rRNA (cytosine967-C5)-methyltransferase
MFPLVPGTNPREIAVRLLQGREKRGQYTEEVLAEELAKVRLRPADRALVQELAYGVVRWQATLDWLVQQKTPPGRNQKIVLLILLRLGLYQLFWLERIPDHAAVHETVALAKKLGFGHQAGFINAILREYLRERPRTEQLLAHLREQQPALGRSHPDWLFERWERQWGRDQAVRLMDWNNRPPPTYARANTLRAGADQLVEAWKNELVDFTPVDRDWLPPGLLFELKSHPPLRELASFRSGWFYIQDPSTLLAASLLDAQPDEAVLDLCAAPGGKTTYLAQRMENRGRVVACDVQPQRLKLLRENCARLGAVCVETTDTLESGKQFDRVLVDAPCSNTGVMRRRVDLRWRIRTEEIERLQADQIQLLKTGSSAVKPAGVLVYSTCSLEPEENRQVVDAFLRERPEFRLASERHLRPFVEEVDGAYVARLVRSGSHS